MLAGNHEATVHSDSVPQTASSWVERRANLGEREFRQKYVQMRRPVVLSDALRNWRALKIFAPNFFRRRFANLPVQLRGKSSSLGAAIDLQLASSREKPGPYPCTLAECTELLPYLTPRFACSLPTRHASRLVPKNVFNLINHMEIFFGGPGGEFPRVHCDMFHLHAWITQVHGEKEITLFEHGQEHLLYVNPQVPWLSLVHDPRDHARYPLLREARMHHVVLRAGDALFVPAGTWHTARCLGMNITVAFDQLEASNWSAFADDVAAEQRRHGRPFKAWALRCYLRALGPLLSTAEFFGAHRRTDWPRERSRRTSIRRWPAGARTRQNATA